MSDIESIVNRAVSAETRQLSARIGDLANEINTLRLSLKDHKDSLDRKNMEIAALSARLVRYETLNKIG
jgi:septal ring factor EnvC (AmiA/AmiB activator)